MKRTNSFSARASSVFTFLLGVILFAAVEFPMVAAGQAHWMSPPPKPNSPAPSVYPGRPQNTNHSAVAHRELIFGLVIAAIVVFFLIVVLWRRARRSANAINPSTISAPTPGRAGPTVQRGFPSSGAEMEDGGWQPAAQRSDVSQPGDHPPANRPMFSSRPDMIRGEVRKFSSQHLERGVMNWNFRVVGYDPDGNLQEIAVQLLYVTKGMLNDGDQVMVRGAFDANAIFVANAVRNLATGATIGQDETMLKTVEYTKGCLKVFLPVHCLISLIVGGGILAVFATFLYHFLMRK